MGPSHSLVCAPSHSGDFAVALQVQKKTFLSSVAVYCRGAKGPPWWEPSQKGWFFDSPQVHHQ